MSTVRDFRATAEELKASSRNLKAIKQGDVSSVTRLIASQAEASWQKLPRHTQAWLSSQDLYNEGVAFTVTKAAELYNPRKKNKLFSDHRKTKFTTFLTPALHNYYVNVGEYYTAKERDESNTISFDHSKADLKYKFAVDSHENDVIIRIDTERAFCRVFKSASPLLCKYLILWLLSPKTTKFKDGTNFRIACKELAVLCRKFGFTFEQATYITKDEALRRCLMLYVNRPKIMVH